MKFDIGVFFEDLSRNCRLYYNLTRMKCILYEDRRTFMIIFRSVPFRVRNVSDKICRKNQNTHFLFKNFFISENRAVCEITWKNIVEPDRPRITI